MAFGLPGLEPRDWDSCSPGFLIGAPTASCASLVKNLAARPTAVKDWGSRSTPLGVDSSWSEAENPGDAPSSIRRASGRERERVSGDGGTQGAM